MIGNNFMIKCNFNGVPVDWEKIDALMEEWQNETVEHISRIGYELGIEYDQAAGIYYYRSRGRWCQEGEKRLLKHFKDGTMIQGILREGIRKGKFQLVNAEVIG